MSFLIMDAFGMHGGPRLGNQMLQYMSMIGLAKSNNMELRLPAWKYAMYFDHPFPLETFRPEGFRHIQEPAFHYSLSLAGIQDNVNIDRSYLQSEKYFEHCKDEVRQALKFRKGFVVDCLSQFPHAFEKPTIGIHIRRGDYAGTAGKNYINLSVAYYMCTLQDHFPDWREMNLIFFSDDIKYAKAYFECLPNAFFSEGNSDIEDLCLLSQCTHFITANSTFSWVAAWLGEKPGTKIVRPDEYFRGNLKLRCDDKDLWPERWMKSHVNKKIDLTDTTFMIPVTYDHEDRLHNFDLTLKFLQSNFNTNIFVCEYNTDKFRGENLGYMRYLGDYFHRTRMLNYMASKSETPIIFNWDADMMMSAVQVLEAVYKIRSGSADVAYPYDGRFAKVPRSPWFDRVAKNLDVSQLSGIAFSGLEPDRRASVGGAVAFNKESYWKGGGENENYISYGPEDRERFYRFTTLGFKVERVRGILYHMNHFKGKNSRPDHENHGKNMDEHRKVKSMDADQLREYVKTFKWLPNTPTN